MKVEGDGARLVRAFSRWQKVGQKGRRDAADDELRRMAGRPGGAGKNWPPPSLAAQSRVIRGAARPYVAPILTIIMTSMSSVQKKKLKCARENVYLEG